MSVSLPLLCKETNSDLDPFHKRESNSCAGLFYYNFSPEMTNIPARALETMAFSIL